MSEIDSPQIIAGEAAVIARRYAKALYLLAAEKKQIEAIAADLRAIKTILRDSADFRRITKHQRITRAQLVKAMQGVTAAAGLSDLTGNFLARLAKNRRLAHLDDIIGAFLADLIARRGEHIAEVHTAKPLSPAQAETLTKQLEKLTGGKVHTVMREDAGLLGGVTVKVGSRQLDASLKGKLMRLERQLKSKQEAA